MVDARRLETLPLRLQWLFRLPFIDPERYIEKLLRRINKPEYAAADPRAVAERAIPQNLGISIRSVVPRFNEGGLFVTYLRPPEVSDADVERAVVEHLTEHPIRPWFNPGDEVGVGRVLGVPWIEDLYLFPSSKIKVEFLPAEPGAAPNAAELNQEALFSIFRRYGKIKEIEIVQPTDKTVPKYAWVQFVRAKSAILARSCVHGLKTSGDRKAILKITYQPRVKGRWIRDWMFNHPRIVIPALAALLASITVVVFDPIRTFCIKVKINYLLNSESGGPWEWVRRLVKKANILSLHPYRKTESSMLAAIWDDRKADIEQIHAWMMDNTSTFIVVQGPHGSGKRELVMDHALKNHKYKVLIDCKPIQDARGDAATISAAAVQVGYRPVFSWLNSLSSFIDMASQGVIGTKAGFSETLDAQLSKIWASTARALKQLALEAKQSDEKDSQLSDAQYLESHPDRRPVVIIDNFLYRQTSETSLVYVKLAEWAAALVTEDIAHVIFLTPEPSFARSLSRALPNQVFRTISLGDCSLEVGKKFVMRFLQGRGSAEEDHNIPPPDVPQGLDDLEECIATLGGRLTDLEFMAHRIKAGETPKSKSNPPAFFLRETLIDDFFFLANPPDAVNLIIEQAATEILKFYLLEVDTSKRHWTREQAWYLIKQLASSSDGTVPYNRILLSDLYKDHGEETLQALEQAELIAVRSVNGRPTTIRPGRPVYHAAFRRLTADRALGARLDLATYALLINHENAKVGKYEAELQLLGNLQRPVRELGMRYQWLAEKVQHAQARIEGYERDSKRLSRVLQTEE